MPHRTLRHAALRPRAGGPATALFLGGLALSGFAALGMHWIEPAGAQTVDARARAMDAHPEAAHTPNGRVSAPRRLAPTTAVTPEEGDHRTDPQDHLPSRMR